jgi:hypothetical protein
MTALIVAQATAVALLGLLVAGLLRSHAEILRKLHALGAGDPEPAGPAGPAPFAVEPGLAPPRDDFPVASDLTGVTPDDQAIAVGVTGTAHNTLLAFLSSGCLTCAGFWDRFASGAPLGLPEGTRLVVATKGQEAESGAALRRLAPGDLPVVMSTEAWEAYRVPVSPYFVHVDGASGRVLGEGAASRWEQVVDLLGQAAADTGRGGDGRVGSGGARAARADRELAAAGIHPGDPRLWPTTAPGGDGEHA